MRESGYYRVKYGVKWFFAYYIGVGKWDFLNRKDYKDSDFEAIDENRINTEPEDNSDNMCFHECPDCNSRCNCSTPKCSCCNDL